VDTNAPVTNNDHCLFELTSHKSQFKWIFDMPWKHSVLLE